MLCVHLRAGKLALQRDPELSEETGCSKLGVLLGPKVLDTSLHWSTFFFASEIVSISTMLLVAEAPLFGGHHLSVGAHSEITGPHPSWPSTLSCGSVFFFPLEDRTV